MGLLEIMHGAADVLGSLIIPVNSGGAPIVQQPMVCEFMPSNLVPPCFVLHPDTGHQDYPRPVMLEVISHDFDADLYFSQGDALTGVDANLRPFVDIVCRAINQNITLGGTCLAAAVTDYHYGGFTYADVAYTGIRFVIHVQEVNQVVYHA